MDTITITKTGERVWESEDGRILIVHDHTFQTECDEPHPVRMSMETVREFSDWAQRAMIARGTIKTNPKTGAEYLTWYCDGGEEHYYAMWTVQIDGEWTDDVYDTFTQAVGKIEDLTGAKVKRAARRKTKPGTYHAVFAVATDGTRSRVGEPTTWAKAIEEFHAADDAIRAGEREGVRFVAVREVKVDERGVVTTEDPVFAEAAGVGA